MVLPATVHPGPVERDVLRRNEQDSVVTVHNGHVVGPAVPSALENQSVVSLVLQVFRSRRLDHLDREILDAGFEYGRAERGQPWFPDQAGVERQGLGEPDPVAGPPGEPYRPLERPVRQELVLVGPVVGGRPGPIARHVPEQPESGIVADLQHYATSRAETAWIVHSERERAAARLGRDRAQRLRRSAFVAEPAFQPPVVRLDRGHQAGPSVAMAHPDEAAGPAPRRVVAAEAAAVDPDDLLERAGRDERGLAGTFAAQHA